MGRGFAIRVAPAAVFLAAFFVVPLGVLVTYSVGTSTFVSLEFGFSPDNYLDVLESSLFRSVYVRTLLIGALVGAVCVAVAYPFAYAITLGPLRRHGDLLLFLVLVSLFSAYIVRVYAWRTLLGNNGAINSGLDAIGVIGEPLDFLLYSRFALVLTLVNVLVPLAVLPLYASLSGLDPQLSEASRTLGASPLRTLWAVTLPLSSRGIYTAFLLCFVLAAGDYVTPQLVGGPNGLLVGNLIVARFGVAFDWPLGAAMAFVLVVAMAVVVAAIILAARRAGLRDVPR
jgi:spermidine/putrescine transport system permease protein